MNSQAQIAHMGLAKKRAAIRPVDLAPTKEPRGGRSGQGRRAWNRETGALDPSVLQGTGQSLGHGNSHRGVPTTRCPNGIIAWSNVDTTSQRSLSALL